MFKHIRTKLLVTIIPVLFLIIVCIFEISAISEFQVVMEETEDKMNSIQIEQTIQIESVLDSMIRMVTNLAIFVEETHDHETLEVYESMLMSVVETKSVIYGLGIWFEPYTYDSNKEYVAPYAYKENGIAKITYEYENNEYDYFNQEYYMEAKETGKVVVTNPYFDEASNSFFISCAMPFYDTAGVFLGCVSADFELLHIMQEFVKRFNEDYSYFYIIDEYGFFVGSTEIEQVKSKENILTSNNESFLKIAHEVLEQEKGVGSYKKDGKKYQVYYNTVHTFGWKLVTIIPRKVLYKPIYK